MFKPNWYEDILKEDKEKQQAKPILAEFIRELQVGYAKYKEIKNEEFHKFLMTCVDYDEVNTNHFTVEYKGEVIEFRLYLAYGLRLVFSYKGNVARVSPQDGKLREKTNPL